MVVRSKNEGELAAEGGGVGECSQEQVPLRTYTDTHVHTARRQKAIW